MVLFFSVLLSFHVVLYGDDGGGDGGGRGYEGRRGRERMRNRSGEDRKSIMNSLNYTEES